ncbi:beta-1,3-galactosyltransferase 2 [Lepisosteus oculatus]|uniref:beta-1,3-galactosyltransferase 2 n=1 Tax=Lepisosteus oculatus TaxID=7918 RepID=UPI0035F51068
MVGVWLWRRGRCLLFTGLLSLLIYLVWFPREQHQRQQLVESKLYKVISPSTYRYILNEPDKCRDMSPFLILMIPVAPTDRAARDAIRKTWGREGLIPGVIIGRIFYVGLPQGDQAPRIQVALEEESREHRDIVQKDFLDSYRNLTIKTMMILDWLATYCPGASYAMKIDTDMFLNVDYLVNKVLDTRSVPAKEDFITGAVIADGRPRRSKESKWYMPEDAYPEDTYPPYVSGTGYVFSVGLAKKLLSASKFVRPVPLEDIYLGLCLQVLGVLPRRSSWWRSLFNIQSMAYERCIFSQLVTVTGYTPSKLLHVWHDFSKAKFTC